MTKRLLIGTAAAVVTALALLLGAVLAADPASRPRRTGSATSSALLGLAYQQRARETGDSSYYTRAERALREALARDRSNLYALGGLGSLALSRHRFREALVLGRRAQRLSPSTARTYGVIGDALLELGRYKQAFRAYDRMAALKPSLSAYARVSHARELLGDGSGAVAAMQLAVAAAGAQPEPLAWSRVHLGKLHFSRGRVREATREYRAALAAFPGYVYALDGLARTEAAQGRLARAVALQQKAVERNPLPEFVGFLGDLYHLAGQDTEAGKQYALVGAIEQLLRANGVRTDLETALFNVDHGLRLRDSLSSARRAHRERPSIEAEDVLAWALARNGHCGEALRYSKRALRLSSVDAPKLFHRGMIERCLGRHATARAWFARALDVNPRFSPLWAPVARRYAS